MNDITNIIVFLEKLYIVFRRIVRGNDFNLFEGKDTCTYLSIKTSAKRDLNSIEIHSLNPRMKP